MAQKITVIEELIDDLDGSEADETVTFGFNGDTYEIDLNKVHAQDMRSMMAVYCKVARKVKGSGKKRTTSAASSPVVSNPAGVSDSEIRANRAQNKKIREWGRSQGMDVPSHGKLPEAVREAYNKAHGVETVPGPTR